MPVLLSAAISALNLGVMVFSWIATYQEYRAHAELIEPIDSGLSRKWSWLFWWGCAAAVFASLGSVFMSMIVAQLELAVTTVVSVATFLVHLPGKVITAVYLVFLHRMIKLLTAE